jgi:hypothetical protein
MVFMQNKIKMHQLLCLPDMFFFILLVFEVRISNEYLKSTNEIKFCHPNSK